MKLAKVKIIESTKERIEEIEKWLKLNEQFLILNKKWILTHIEINKIQEEADIDNLTDEQKSEIDKEKRKDFPKIEREYLQYLLLPFIIYFSNSWKEKCIDNFETSDIEVFNEALTSKINLYTNFLQNV